METSHHNRMRTLQTAAGQRARSAFTLIELLVVIGIIGVLLALTLPAIHQVRSAARKTECQNKLRQIAIAFHNHHNNYGHLPKDGQNQWSHLVFILPQIDQSALFDKIDPYRKSRNTSGPADPNTSGVVLKVYRCPAFIPDLPANRDHLSSGYGRTNYLGTRDLFSEEMMFTDVYDGESATFLAGETTRDHAWAIPQTGTGGGFPGAYDSDHTGGANFAMCDGSVHFITYDIDASIFVALFTTAGKEPVGDF